MDASDFRQWPPGWRDRIWWAGHRFRLICHVVRHWLSKGPGLRWLDPWPGYFGCPVCDAELREDAEARRELHLDDDLNPL
jgi:hypothetical protein